MQAFRSALRVAARATPMTARFQPAAVASFRPITYTAPRLSTQEQIIKQFEATPDLQEDVLARLDQEIEAEQVAKVIKSNPDWTEGTNTRMDETGMVWADYRPENVRNLTYQRNEDGDLVGTFEGEQVIFPDLEPTLEWVLSTPVDAHLFEEAPIIKMYEEEAHEE